MAKVLEEVDVQLYDPYGTPHWHRVIREVEAGSQRQSTPYLPPVIQTREVIGVRTNAAGELEPYRTGKIQTKANNPQQSWGFD